MTRDSTATAQTGLTIWNALLIASIPAVITAILGFFLTQYVSAKNISQQVKEELEKEMKLLDEKIRKEREDRWWKAKFDCFIELNEILSEMYTYNEKTKIFTLSISESLQKINNFGLKSSVLFEDESLNDKISEITTALYSEKNSGVVEFSNSIIENVSVKISVALTIIRDQLIS